MSAENIQAQSEIVHGGYWQSAAGLVISAWSWLVGDANGLTIILTITTIVLTLIKTVDAYHAWRRTSGSFPERIKQITKPADFDATPRNFNRDE